VTAPDLAGRTVPAPGDSRGIGAHLAINDEEQEQPCVS
jgi:hypothetical protein